MKRGTVLSQYGEPLSDARTPLAGFFRILLETAGTDYHAPEPCTRRTHKLVCRRRNAFEITDSELHVMAALAIIGLRRMPNTG